MIDRKRTYFIQNSLIIFQKKNLKSRCGVVYGGGDSEMEFAESPQLKNKTKNKNTGHLLLFYCKLLVDL